MTRRRIARQAEELLQAIVTADVECMHDLLAEEIRWHYPPSAADVGYPATASGRRAVAELLASSRNRHYRDLTAEVVHAIVDGDLVGLLVDMRGVTLSGRDYNNRYAFHVRFDSRELITEAWEVADTAHAMKLFGSGSEQLGQ